MMNRASSATGWVRNPDGTMGYTWNPITGCLNGCGYCYARKLARGRLRTRYLKNWHISTERLPDGMCLTQHPNDDPFYPRFWPERLEELNDRRQGIYYTKYYKQKGIFVCDMSDLFGIGIPEDWTRCVLSYIKSCPRYRFYLLTKQPQNLIKFSPFPENCWVGVTAITNAHLLLAMGQLERIEAKIKYLSIEPMLYELDGFKFAINNSINQVIIGAQTKPYKPPKIEDVKEIVQACDKAGVKVFLKDNLYPLFNVNTQTDASSLHINYSWAFKETKFKGENDKVEYRGRVILLRQEMPKCQIE